MLRYISERTVGKKKRKFSSLIFMIFRPKNLHWDQFFLDLRGNESNENQDFQNFLVFSFPTFRQQPNKMPIKYWSFFSVKDKKNLDFNRAKMFKTSISFRFLFRPTREREKNYRKKE